jgi:hypothetical protein
MTERRPDLDAASRIPGGIERALAMATLLSALAAASAHAQCDVMAGAAQPASGVVFDDLNRNGSHDAGEPAVAGVRVSNGCDVVLSDSVGRYEIGLAPGQILFLSQPTGYVVPVDDANLPLFYYSHYPNGTPTAIDGASVDWQWPVIEPTGPLPASIDFPLHRLDARETRFTAHAFADPQARTDLEEDMLRQELVNTLLGNPYGAEFSITVGDVVFDNLALYDRYKEMMGAIGITQWNLPGNHDVNFESPDAHHANETYKKHFGPTYYSFEYGNAHVVALNNVEYAGADDGSYRGFISDDQIHWLGQDLAHVSPDMLIVIATHIPLITEASDGDSSRDITGPGTLNFDRLLELLRPFDHVYGLAGHDTNNSWKVEIGHEHGWTGQPWIAHTLAEVRGSGWNGGPRDLRGVADAMMADGNPNGFYLLKFDDVTLVPEFIPFPFGPDAGQRMRIALDPGLEARKGGSINRGTMRADTKVVVNLFDGGARDRVRMSLDGGSLTPMRYVLRTDPWLTRARQQLADGERPFPSAVVSAHIWELALPDDLGPGLHHVVVESEDEFGQRQRGVLSFEVTGPNSP